MRLQRYNKFWAALVPMLVMLAGMYAPDAGITEDDLNHWWHALGMVVTPFLVWLVPNKE